MRLIDALTFGLTLGGTYSLIALGLNLQYGVARILNLAYGEMTIAGAFVGMLAFTHFGISPLVSAIAAIPVALVLGALLYRVAFEPLVRRAADRDALEADTILSTFGLLFLMQGVMLALFGGNYMSYSYLAVPIQAGETIIAANRLIAMIAAFALGGALFWGLKATRIGTALRAVAFNPESAPLVGIDVRFAATWAFGLGTAMVVVSGILTSMFSTFSASMGVVFTMKALIIIIMGGIGNFAGCVLAALLLGLTESMVATFVDPGLTLISNYVLFLAVLVFRPAGLFGRSAR